MESENRKKMQRVCDISLANAMMFGFDKTRESIWNEVLQREAGLIVADELPLSAKGTRKGKQAVRSLKDATAAAQAGLVSKKLFNHFFQTKLRVYIDCAIEDAIPGKWPFVWSNTVVKEVCFTLNSLLSSVLSSKSQLLQAMPTAAALAFLEFVREFEGVSVLFGGIRGIITRSLCQGHCSTLSMYSTCRRSIPQQSNALPLFFA